MNTNGNERSSDDVAEMAVLVPVDRNRRVLENWVERVGGDRGALVSIARPVAQSVKTNSDPRGRPAFYPSAVASSYRNSRRFSTLLSPFARHAARVMFV
jgi:hypothetical protein